MVAGDFFPLPTRCPGSQHALKWLAAGTYPEGGRYAVAVCRAGHPRAVWVWRKVGGRYQLRSDYSPAAVAMGRRLYGLPTPTDLKETAA